MKHPLTCSINSIPIELEACIPWKFLSSRSPISLVVYGRPWSSVNWGNLSRAKMRPRENGAINEREKRPWSWLFHSDPSTFLHYRYTNFTSGWLGKRKEKKKGRGEISKRWEKQARRVGIFFLGGRGETITISANISKGLDNYQRAAIPPCPRRGSIHPFLNPRRVEKKISRSFRGRGKNFFPGGKYENK